MVQLKTIYDVTKATTQWSSKVSVTRDLRVNLDVTVPHNALKLIA